MVYILADAAKSPVETVPDGNVLAPHHYTYAPTITNW